MIALTNNTVYTAPQYTVIYYNILYIISLLFDLLHIVLFIESVLSFFLITAFSNFGIHVYTDKR
jgi:hypothetical protein